MALPSKQGLATKECHANLIEQLKALEQELAANRHEFWDAEVPDEFLVACMCPWLCPGWNVAPRLYPQNTPVS